MEKLTKKWQETLKNCLWLAVCVISAVALPQVFHALGMAFKVGGGLGQMFLPMYLPVLVLSLKKGTVLGAVAGALSPAVSFAISGMPNEAMLLFVTVELVCFGLFGGMFSKRDINVFAKILMVQLLSHAVRVAVTLALTAFMGGEIVVSTILSATLTAIPGYLLQLAVVPFFVNKRC